MLRYRDVIEEEYRAYRMSNGAHIIYDDVSMSYSEEYFDLIRSNEFINRVIGGL